MIETENERQATLSWIRYWKESIAAGDQSWLAQEQAQEEIMKLHRQVDAYEKRVRGSIIVPVLDDFQPLALEPVEVERAGGTQLRSQVPASSRR